MPRPHKSTSPLARAATALLVGAALLATPSVGMSEEGGQEATAEDASTTASELVQDDTAYEPGTLDDYVDDATEHEDLEPEPVSEFPVLSEAVGAAILDDAGNVLYAKDEERELPLASITKVMTAMVALDSGIPLDQTIELVEPDLGGDSQMADFANGDRLTLREVMQVMLVYSANDAAYNVAMTVGGSIESFADMMNAKAAQIGMQHTHFVNPHGLEADGHYSCAIDLARMSRHAMQNYPFIAQTVEMPSVTLRVAGEPRTYYTTDQLLGAYPGARGVKTGAAAWQYTFLGAATRGNIGLYTAVLGCVSNAGRFGDTQALMDWAFAKYGETTLNNPSWVVRLQPYAFDLGLKAVVSTSETAHGTVWPEGGSATYANVIARPGHLFEASDTCGWSDWSQDGRPMGGVRFVTRDVPVRVASWPIFSLPLFASTSTLGQQQGQVSLHG